MKVGIPREVKNNEFRVAITPAGVHELVRHGHQVFVEQNAGVGSSITDEEYVAAGAEILPTADEVWATADLLLKVKEPIAEEYHRLRKDQTLFTYLHLAASKECTDALLASGTTAIAYETVETANRALPLLAPMSEVAGRLAPQVGAYHLMRSVLRSHDLPGFAPRIALRLTTTPVDTPERPVGVGTLDQVLDDLDQLRLLGADTVVLDPYHGDPEETRRPHEAWRALTAVATHGRTPQ